MAPSAPTKKKSDFDPLKFLATIGEGRKVMAFPKKETVFAQGDAADSVFYIQAGKIRLTVVSKIGKEATWHIERGTVFWALNENLDKCAYYAAF